MSQVSTQMTSRNPVQALSHEITASAQPISTKQLTELATSKPGSYTRCYFKAEKSPMCPIQRPDGTTHDVTQVTVELPHIFAVMDSPQPSTTAKYYKLDGGSMSAWLQLYRDLQIVNSKRLRGRESITEDVIEGWISTAWEQLWQGKIPPHIRHTLHAGGDHVFPDFDTLGLRETITTNFEAAQKKRWLHKGSDKNAQDLEVFFHCKPSLQSQFDSLFEKDRRDRVSRTASSSAASEPWAVRPSTK